MSQVVKLGLWPSTRRDYVSFLLNEMPIPEETAAPDATPAQLTSTPRRRGRRKGQVTKPRDDAAEKHWTMAFLPLAYQQKPRGQKLLCAAAEKLAREAGVEPELLSEFSIYHARIYLKGWRGNKTARNFQKTHLFRPIPYRNTSSAP